MRKLNFINREISLTKEYKALTEKLSKSGKEPLWLTGLSLVHKACIIYSLCAKRAQKGLVIASNESEAQRLANDLNCMGKRALVYPAKDINLADIEGKSREYEHQRINVLSKIINDQCDIIIACIDSALQYTMPPEFLKERSFLIEVKKHISPTALVKSLILSGFERYEQVEGTGQFALRGGILDIFPPNLPSPVRIEFWGDEVDTISYFDLESQRRTDMIEEVLISPACETVIPDREILISKIEKVFNALGPKQKSRVSGSLKKDIEALKNQTELSCPDKFLSLLYNKKNTLFDYIDSSYIIFQSEPLNINKRAISALDYLNEVVKTCIEDGIICKGLDVYSEDFIYFERKLSLHSVINLETFIRSPDDSSQGRHININCTKLSAWNGNLGLLYEDINPLLGKGYRGVILAGNEKSAKTLTEDLKKGGINAVYQEKVNALLSGGIIVTYGSLSSGFYFNDIKLFVITHSHITETKKKKRRKSKDLKEIFSLEDLNIGDYVVHVTNGIGIFNGIHKIETDGIKKDYIKISYAKGDVLYVPVTQLDMISKYIGAKESSNIKLSTLGGSQWQKTKARAKKAAKDIAKDLIELYSQRLKIKGYAFSADGEWQRDFESRFEFEETEDQLRCINEIKDDMERVYPMDRLLCGDVGFGKTEVALRAAFKCVSDSKQCAMLVPTTILAWQHYQTMLKRFETFPVKVELLSRFKSPKQQEEIIKKIKSGDIDIVVGTHRLLQKDMKFRDLGLVIIDEEQRFGVKHKEQFKSLKQNVDVLTLSATPIPRTLNMAMSGVRDMSSLEEAPQDRHPVQTYVLEHNNNIISEAMRRELRRGGQVYYLHNRVESIEKEAIKIKSELPDVKIGIAHGRMSETELSEVWRKVLEQEIDILVCTTIIETGIDVPNVNTIIITNADHMGLSQLHQLRGRVGRSSRRAYAYLTFKKDKILTEISEKRLAAIRDFTEFGSGFKIAMRDLELRGAGNILGGEQHGHMEAIGYDLYLKILNEAISKEKGEKKTHFELECTVDLPVPAHIPEDYIRDINQRLSVYRKISDIRSDNDASDVLDELIDRFGDVPNSVNGLIDIALIRTKAAKLGIYEIKQLNQNILLFQRKLNMDFVSELLSKLKGRVMVNAGGKPYISVKLKDEQSSLDLLKKVLKFE